MFETESSVSREKRALHLQFFSNAIFFNALKTQSIWCMLLSQPLSVDSTDEAHQSMRLKDGNRQLIDESQ